MTKGIKRRNLQISKFIMLLKINYTFSVCVNNLVINTLIRRFQWSKSSKESTLRYVTHSASTLYANVIKE